MSDFIQKFKAGAPSLARKAALCLSVSGLLFVGAPHSNAALQSCTINNSGDCVGSLAETTNTPLIESLTNDSTPTSATDLLGDGSVIIEKAGGGEEAAKTVEELKTVLDEMPPEFKNAALSKVAEAAQGNLNLDQLKNLVSNLSGFLTESKLAQAAITAGVSALASGGDAKSFFSTMAQQMLQGTPIGNLTSSSFNPQAMMAGAQKQFDQSQFHSGQFDPTYQVTAGDGDGTLSANSNKHAGLAKDVQYRITPERDKLDTLMRDGAGNKTGINVGLYERINTIEKELGGGDVLFSITSGYRSPSYNKKVGGANQSRHMSNDAMDFKAYRGGARIANSQILKVACALAREGNGGVGNYGESGHVHVDTRSGQSAWKSCKPRKSPKCKSVNAAFRKSCLGF